jgi:hypothetical protein
MAYLIGRILKNKDWKIEYTMSCSFESTRFWSVWVYQRKKKRDSFKEDRMDAILPRR